MSVRALVLGASLLVWAGGCLPSPQLSQSVELLERLGSARTGFATDSQAACDTVGAVQTRLDGEPGLTAVAAWGSLRKAAEALQAVCGQRLLLQADGGNSAALDAARERWQRGAQRQLGVACDHLRAAAHALDHAAPC